MARARMVNSSTFKAQCLALMKDIDAGRLDEIIVTRRGRPCVKVLPVQVLDAPAPGYGFMKGSVKAGAGLDLTSPVIELPADWPPAPR